MFIYPTCSARSGIRSKDYYGILPLILGSLVVTIGAALFGVPVGILTAVYISEIAPRWAKEILKPLIEILAGIPSVVLGFLGALVLAPFLRESLNLPTGLTALTGSILLGAIAIPTIVSISEDALNTVPRVLPRSCPGAWHHPLADHLGCDRSGGALRHPDGGHAGDRPVDRRNHDGHDGDRQCTGHAGIFWGPVRSHPHHDRHDRLRNG